MANTKHEPAATPLLSDDDLERPSVAQESFEYVDYESSDPESLTLSGSTVIDDTPLHDTSFTSKDEWAKSGVVPGPEALPKYEPRVSETEIAYSKKDGLEEGLVEEGEEGGNKRCRRRRCFRGRCRRASTRCDDKKRRVRRRIVMFIKAMFLFGLFSFVMTRMCLRHRRSLDKEGDFPGFEGHYPEDLAGDFHGRRRIIVNKGSQAVFGRYPLYDLLSLKTTSGSVNIIVEPQPADPNHPDEPARLLVETESGSVSISFLHHSIDTMVTFGNGDTKPVDDVIDIEYLKNSGATSVSQVQAQLPYRPYEIQVITKSGSINGKFLFTTAAHLESRSGHISASFTPVVSTEDTGIHAKILTETYSGAQGITLTEPLFIYPSKEAADAEDAFLTSSSSTTSSHTTHSGSIDVNYPHSWAGDVEASSMSGSVILNGDGLEVTEQGRGYAKGIKYPEDDEEHKWWGSRGDMDVQIVSTQSGSIMFHVKDWPYDLLENDS